MDFWSGQHQFNGSTIFRKHTRPNRRLDLKCIGSPTVMIRAVTEHLQAPFSGPFFSPPSVLNQKLGYPGRGGCTQFRMWRRIRNA